MSAMAELHDQMLRAKALLDKKILLDLNSEDHAEKRLREVLAALQEAIDFIEQYSDVVDGPDGPEPNAAMSMATHLQLILDGGY